MSRLDLTGLARFKDNLLALVGRAGGIAGLDSNGKVPSSQLPSYVDDVVEYATLPDFPATGESGKIYVATSTNKGYRWSGSQYVEIASSLALGTTASTAFAGDKGQEAYTHAVTNKGSAFSSGLYKITTNSEGHVTGATAVVKSDITGLGIPGSDTTYENRSEASGGVAVSLVTTGDKYNWNRKADAANPAITGTVTFGETTLTETQLQDLLDVAYPLISFVRDEEDGGGTLQSIQTKMGTTPAYSGTEPTTTRGTDYTFSGWTPDLSVALLSQTYTATFEKQLVIPYLSGTMTELDAPYITSIRPYAFEYMTTLASVTTNATYVGTGAFSNCTGLTEIHFGGSSVPVLEATSAIPTLFTLPDAERAIYVPDDLVDSYKEASNWTTYADSIYSEDDYPITSFDTVSDSWAEIVAAAADGTHSTKYTIGTSTKKLTYGSYTVYMQYIGDRTEGPVWAVKNFAETRRFHSAMTPYDGSEIDTYVNETVYESLPSEVQNGIAEVSIPYYDGVVATEKSIDRKVWLLSSQEVGFGTLAKESTGTAFSSVFSSAASRIKYNKSTGSASNWWTRSSYSSTYVFGVINYGTVGGGNATTTYGVVFGFCLKGPSS